MLQLNRAGLNDRAGWEAAHVRMPGFDVDAMAEKTRRAPVWVHFGAGNIFRGFVACLQQALLEKGLADTGIVAAESFDFDVVDKIYVPHDNFSLLCGLRADGSVERSIVASVGEAVTVRDFDRLKEIFRAPSLQMVSFTITEKGYALRGLDGNFTRIVAADMENGPEKPVHAMSIVAACLLERYNHGAAPLAVVSMDNCSHNGEKLRAAVTEVVHQWHARGHVEQGFVDYVEDEARVSFPWSMIDKITPRPAQSVFEMLEKDGIADMQPIVTGRGTFIAPFVNAEIPQYLVVEDRFPNGRPALEEAGVYMTDRDTVNNTERMKVTTCLNPLHTALAVYGCLLGYQSIASEMKDAQLRRLVERIGRDEGMKVVVDPGIIRPENFLSETLTERLPNPFIPDTPQRIATDTSQKVGVRFGETIKAYVAREDLNPADLTAIPLAIAGWLRYLLGVDDDLQPFEMSADPMLEQLREALKDVRPGDPESVGDAPRAILTNKVLFGVDLYEAGLGERVTGMLRELNAGKGAIRATLVKYMGE